MFYLMKRNVDFKNHKVKVRFGVDNSQIKNSINEYKLEDCLPDGLKVVSFNPSQDILLPVSN